MSEGQQHGVLVCCFNLDKVSSPSCERSKGSDWASTMPMTERVIIIDWVKEEGFGIDKGEIIM